MGSNTGQAHYFETTQVQTWLTIRAQSREIEQAAKRLQTSTTTSPQAEHQTPQPRSAIERLPEEVLLAIMACLDYESLYRLSQASPYFLRLSFDDVFELDPGWRTFRFTVDSLVVGPRGRLFCRAGAVGSG
ncbi:hypothetical protein GGS21DRAFT_486538 [Xylaria nigripes]|nr:hypothetical protein GGS21DRAFT_486538 [Xylaria nigripes]